MAHEGITVTTAPDALNTARVEMPKHLAFATAFLFLSGCTTEALLPAGGPLGQTVGYPRKPLAAASVVETPVSINLSSHSTSVPAALETSSLGSSRTTYDEATDPLYRSAMAPPASQAFGEKLERKADGTIRLPPPAQIPVIDTSGTYAALAVSEDTEAAIDKSLTSGH